MKHIRQSTKQHTTGPFNITEDMPFLTFSTDLSAIIGFPIADSFKKPIPVFWRTDFGDLKEDISKPTSVDCPGRCTAPGQALPLNMDQTALNEYLRPERTKYFHHRRITIYRKALRVQSSLFQALKICPQFGFRVFRDIILTGYERVCFGIHKSNKPTGAVQESPIKDKMSASFQCQSWWRRCLYQQAVYHTIQLSRTITALIRQLPGRITFNHPKPKQFLFSGMSDFFTSAPSTKRASARSAKPALFSFNTMTISPENF